MNNKNKKIKENFSNLGNFFPGFHVLIQHAADSASNPNSAGMLEKQLWQVDNYKTNSNPMIPKMFVLLWSEYSFMSMDDQKRVLVTQVKRWQ